MRNLIIGATLLTLLSFGFKSQEIDQLAIIVAKSEQIDKLTIDEVRDIFLKNSASFNLSARDMKEGTEERNLFGKLVLKLSDSQLRDHWSDKMNEGIDKWPTKSSARALVSFVSRGGRIGYVDAATLPSLPKFDKIKVVTTISK